MGLDAGCCCRCSCRCSCTRCGNKGQEDELEISWAAWAMNLGINLPNGGEAYYGWDIGPQAVAVDGSTQSDEYIAARLVSPGTRGDKTNLDTKLANLKRYGIDCIRMWLLSDGVNLPPPTIDSKKKQWQVTSSTLDPTHISDFRTILEACVRQDMLIVPVFVDFYLFAPPRIMIQHFGGPDDPKVSSGAVYVYETSQNSIGPVVPDSVDDFVTDFYSDPSQLAYQDNSKSVDWHRFVKGGRAPILRSRGAVDSFLKSTLQPLLNVAASQADFNRQIVAWDIINEPEVALAKYLSPDPSIGWSMYAADPVEGYPLVYFIEASASMIFSAQMKATVGFQTAMPLGRDDGFQSSLKGNALSTEITEIKKVVTTILLSDSRFLPQCHYYPGHSGQTDLLPKETFKLPTGSKLILGEFATKIDSTAGKSPWGSDITATDSVSARLQAAKSKGYDWAFPWAAVDGMENSRFNQATINQYKAFQPF
jgi:hypothetical protein